jgi:NADPH:quinone reductase-like Zn-dependent oxidoreductase
LILRNIATTKAILHARYAAIPLPYPTILGSSFAGGVEGVVHGFQVGVCVVVKRPLNKAKDSRYSAFQKYAPAREFTTCKLADNTSFEDAAATILNLATAVAALVVYIGLDRAPIEGPARPSGKRILIYGGSSSVGGLATRYAADAGYEVVTTSSPRNEVFVSSFGAKVVIDHTQSPVSLVTALKSHGPYEATLDCINTPPVDAIIAKVLGEMGGTYYAIIIIPQISSFKMPANVKRELASFSAVLDNKNRDLGEYFYKDYLPKGLASGRIAPTRVEKVKGGLGGMQEALDRSLAVSGTKVVVDPWE